MNPLNLAVAMFALLPLISANTPANVPEKKPVIRNFMVTECKKNTCLMKMRPHEKHVDKNGRIYWVKIQ